MQQRETGTVKWFDSAKGYGFVHADDGRDLFLHRSALPPEGWVADGDRVGFFVEQGSKGPNAVGIEVIARSGHQPRPRLDRATPPNGNAPWAPAVSDGAVVRGTVVRYDCDRGFGFIRPEPAGPDIFVHRSAAGRDLMDGQRVECRVGRGPKGQRAEQVRVMEADR